MKERLKGCIFFVIGLFLFLLFLGVEGGLLQWIMELIAIYLMIWKGLVKIIRGEAKKESSPSQPTATQPSTVINKCPFCGAEVKPDDNYCTNCGRKLEKVKK
ncbi:hypothetical protein DRN63_04380 [Nanoarchaeota archaeon]|nr:MAG: hypothetical protein DRN63_04380 [Nanoarchaeota archaeon]